MHLARPGHAGAVAQCRGLVPIAQLGVVVGSCGGTGCIVLNGPLGSAPVTNGHGDSLCAVPAAFRRSGVGCQCWSVVIVGMVIGVVDGVELGIRVYHAAWLGTVCPGVSSEAARGSLAEVTVPVG